MAGTVRTVMAAGLIVGLLGGCRQHEVVDPPLAVPFEEPHEIDRLSRDLPYVDSMSWVDVYLPQLAFKGYTLDLYKRRIPALFDMNGRIVHSWPFVRAVGRVRLDRRGRLYVIGIDNRLKEYDWNGNITWWYQLPGEDFPHHDLLQLGNRDYLVVARSDADRTDYLVEVDRRQQVVWSWRAAEHLDEGFPGWNREAWDPTHINSVYELPENRWFDAGDRRFRPGNILVSARNLNGLFIIDKRSGKIVWTYTDGLDYQHEAMMTSPDGPAPGCILFFNNRYHARGGERSSVVTLIDPTTGRLVWSYRGLHMFSSTAGSQQPLPNGNLLITSSQGGRIFEIRPSGQVVWQLVPPSLPMRAERYSYDWCPQFADLERLPLERVDPRSKRAFISYELSKLAIPEEYDVREVHGAQREILRQRTMCGTLLFPPYSTVVFHYGIDPERLGDDDLEVRFRATLQGPDDPKPVLVVEDVVASSDESIWREQVAAAQHYPYMSVEMCVDAEVQSATSGAAVAAATWENPLVASSYRARTYDRLKVDDLSADERKVQEQQLRAIGYIQ